MFSEWLCLRMKQYYLSPILHNMSCAILVLLTCFHHQILKGSVSWPIIIIIIIICLQSAHNAFIHWMVNQDSTGTQENCCNVAQFRGSHSALLLRFKASEMLCFVSWYLPSSDIYQSAPARQYSRNLIQHACWQATNWELIISGWCGVGVVVVFATLCWEFSYLAHWTCECITDFSIYSLVKCSSDEGWMVNISSSFFFLNEDSFQYTWKFLKSYLCSINY